MYKKKKIEIKHKFIIVVSLVIIIIGFFSLTLKEDRKLNKFEALIKDGTTGVERVLGYPFKFIITKIDNIKELNGIRKKYDTLLSKVERIDSLEAENIELRRQLTKLKEELQIEYTLNDYDYLNATIINRNIANWYNSVTIDKGSYNGITEDMIVVNNYGLIGKVISTTAFTSEVRLITSSDTANKISITISDGKNKINGLIKNFNYNTGYLEVEGISNTEYVTEGFYAYTSGLGGVFPSGILIGKVENIKTDEYDLAKQIDVIPSADFNDINYVAVLKRKEITK